MNSEKVDVIIPTYRPDDGFRDLLRRLSKQSLSVSRIIVINTEEKFWNKSWEEEFPLLEVHHLTKEEFAQYTPALPLSTLFFPKDIRYTYEDYRQHLEQTNEYARTHPGYSLRPCDMVFRNISISVHAGRWAMISKSNAPAIHFVIRYSKLRSAIETFIG